MTPILAQKPRTDRSFERLYQRHVGEVYRYALVVLRNQADAEDVTQTTFMNAYRAYQRGERPRAPQNWLIAIAHNVCRQRFRQSARRPHEVAFDEDAAEALVEDEEAPSADEIRRALSHLAFNQRAALVMRELEGRSYAEIAAILDVSGSAVEMLIFRARRALREQLEGGLTCRDAELAVSKQLDGRLSRAEKSALRAHLRECGECARFARRQRAQRTAIRSLGAIPLPSSLSSFFGGGGGGTAAAGGSVAVGGGLAAKAALIGASAIVATGVGYEGVRHAPWHGKAQPRLAASHGAQAATAPAQAGTDAARGLPTGARRSEDVFAPGGGGTSRGEQPSRKGRDAQLVPPGQTKREKTEREHTKTDRVTPSQAEKRDHAARGKADRRRGAPATPVRARSHQERARPVHKPVHEKTAVSHPHQRRSGPAVDVTTTTTDSTGTGQSGQGRGKGKN